MYQSHEGKGIQLQSVISKNYVIVLFCLYGPTLVCFAIKDEQVE